MKVFRLVICVSATVAVLLLITLIHLHGSSIDLANIWHIEEVRRAFDKRFLAGDVPARKIHQSKPILTMFTTVKERGMIPHHDLAFNAVLTNWPSFKPYIQPVLLLNCTNSSLAKRAWDVGWDVLPLTRTNKAGTPFLKDMYRDIFNKYDSTLYGFANGDLLFDDGILDTLKVVAQKMAWLNNNALVIGRRVNVNVNLSYSEGIKSIQKHQFQQLADTRGKLFTQDAIDYFFFTKDGCSLNWSALIDVVIGRPAYDSYLVAMAARYGVNVIDATGTLLAIHLSDKDVFSQGMLNVDGQYNLEKIGEFNHRLGYTTSAKLETAYGVFEDIVLIRRH